VKRQLRLKGLGASSLKKTQEALSFLMAEPAVKKGARAGVAGVLLMVAVLLFAWKRLPPEVPLFYSRPWGESQLAEKEWLWVLPGVGVGVLVLNLKIASLFFKEEPFLIKGLVWGATLIVGLLAVTLLEIVWLVS